MERKGEGFREWRGRRRTRGRRRRMMRFMKGTLFRMINYFGAQTNQTDTGKKIPAGEK